MSKQQRLARTHSTAQHAFCNKGPECNSIQRLTSACFPDLAVVCCPPGDVCSGACFGLSKGGTGRKFGLVRSRAFVWPKSDASTLRKLRFVKDTSPSELVLLCVDQTPPAGGGAAPRRANSEVGELGCCWGSWARVTLRVKYSLFVHRCRCATIAAKVITTATTTVTVRAPMSVRHQRCEGHHHNHNHRRHRRPSPTPSPSS